jgi:hypothetical protein
VSTIIEKWRSIYPLVNAAVDAVKEFETTYAEISLPVTMIINAPSDRWCICFCKGEITVKLHQEIKRIEELPMLLKIEVAARLPQLEKLLEESLDNIIKKLQEKKDASR